MYSDFKGKAIEFVKVAVAEDEAGNYEKVWCHASCATAAARQVTQTMPCGDERCRCCGPCC
jgi:hypothetical protein